MSHRAAVGWGIGCSRISSHRHLFFVFFSPHSEQTFDGTCVWYRLWPRLELETNTTPSSATSQFPFNASLRVSLRLFRHLMRSGVVPQRSLAVNRDVICMTHHTLTPLRRLWHTTLEVPWGGWDPKWQAVKFIMAKWCNKCQERPALLWRWDLPNPSVASSFVTTLAPPNTANVCSSRSLPACSFVQVCLTQAHVSFSMLCLSCHRKAWAPGGRLGHFRNASHVFHMKLPRALSVSPNLKTLRATGCF